MTLLERRQRTAAARGRGHRQRMALAGDAAFPARLHLSDQIAHTRRLIEAQVKERVFQELLKSALMMHQRLAIDDQMRLRRLLVIQRGTAGQAHAQTAADRRLTLLHGAIILRAHTQLRKQRGVQRQQLRLACIQIGQINNQLLIQQPVGALRIARHRQRCRLAGKQNFLLARQRLHLRRHIGQRHFRQNRGIVFLQLACGQGLGLRLQLRQFIGTQAAVNFRQIARFQRITAGRQLGIRAQG